MLSDTYTVTAQGHVRVIPSFVLAEAWILFLFVKSKNYGPVPKYFPSAAQLPPPLLYAVAVAPSSAKRAVVMVALPGLILPYNSSSVSIWSSLDWATAPNAPFFFGIVASLSIICLDTDTMLSSISSWPTSSKCFLGSSLPT